MWPYFTKKSLAIFVVCWLFSVSLSYIMIKNFKDIPTIYVVTPTGNHSKVQMAHMTRMLNTVRLVPNIFWIVVEDSGYKSKRIAKFLENSKIPHIHLSVATPEHMVNIPAYLWLKKPRGMFQRNLAISWLREHSKELNPRGVVYFADDDNTYDTRIFEEMRYTKKVSVWGVAAVGGLMYERPVCQNGSVKSWQVIYESKRPFPIDMAGFAVNLKFLLDNPNASFIFTKSGMLESDFLSQLVKQSDLECKADDGSKIYVWHTKTHFAMLDMEEKMKWHNLTYEQEILDQI